MLALWLALAPVVPPVTAPRPAAIELDWDAPAECPDVDTMRQRIAAVTLDPAGEGTLQVEGRVEETATGYRLTLSTAYGSVSDSRVVVDGDCDALGDAAALVVAVSLEPVGDPTPTEPGPVSTPGPEAVAHEPAPQPLVVADREDEAPPPAPRTTDEWSAGGAASACTPRERRPCPLAETA